MGSVDRSSKTNHFLVRLIHAGGAAYYTDHTSDVFHKGNLYVSTPDMEVDLPEADGLLNAEKGCEIKLPLVDADTDITWRLSRFRKHAPVAVIVEEMTRATVAGPSLTLTRHYHGDVDKVRRNHNQDAKLVVLQTVPVTSRLATARIGLQCLNECLHLLGHGGCGVNIADHQFHGTVTAIDGREVTITGGPGGKPERYYHMGYVSLSGLNIRIRDWKQAQPTKFYLDDLPPQYWLNATVRVRAGCNGTIAKCREFDAEEWFLGLGVAMLPYDPQREVGGA